ncbi:hypothetical protein V502_05297, partial [Pseudogymnoascus sp. VKM F-4520 (FW-2644)]
GVVEDEAGAGEVEGGAEVGGGEHVGEVCGDAGADGGGVGGVAEDDAGLDEGRAGGDGEADAVGGPGCVGADIAEGFGVEGRGVEDIVVEGGGWVRGGEGEARGTEADEEPDRDEEPEGEGGVFATGSVRQLDHRCGFGMGTSK